MKNRIADLFPLAADEDLDPRRKEQATRTIPELPGVVLQELSAEREGRDDGRRGPGSTKWLAWLVVWLSVVSVAVVCALLLLIRASSVERARDVVGGRAEVYGGYDSVPKEADSIAAVVSGTPGLVVQYEDQVPVAPPPERTKYYASIDQLASFYPPEVVGFWDAFWLYEWASSAFVTWRSTRTVGDLEEFGRRVEVGLEQNQDDAKLTFLKGLYLEDQGVRTRSSALLWESIGTYELAYTLDPTHYLARNNHAFVLFRLGEYSKSLGVAENALHIAELVGAPENELDIVVDTIESSQSALCWLAGTLDP